MIYQKMLLMSTLAKIKLSEMLSDESGEVNIVAIVVLIGIAVILALFFKDQILALLQSLFDTITGSAKDAVTPD